MKKRATSLLVILLASLIFLTVHSQAVDDAPDLSDVIGKDVPIDPEKIPQDFEELEREYLQKEWTKFIAENKFFKPIHELLGKISPVFKILIGYSYEISLTFFCILLLWIYITIILFKTINASELLKDWKAFIAGVICSTILAQLKIQYFLVKSALDLIFKPQGWAFKIVLTILILGFIAVIYLTTTMLQNRLRKTKEKKKKKQEERDQRKLSELTKSAEELRRS